MIYQIVARPGTCGSKVDRFRLWAYFKRFVVSVVPSSRKLRTDCSPFLDNKEVSKGLDMKQGSEKIVSIGGWGAAGT